PRVLRCSDAPGPRASVGTASLGFAHWPLSAGYSRTRARHDQRPRSAVRAGPRASVGTASLGFAPPHQRPARYSGVQLSPGALVRGALEDGFHDARGGGSDGGAGAARQAGHPEDLRAGGEHGQERPGLARHLAIDEDVLELARPAREQPDAVAARGRAEDE